MPQFEVLKGVHQEADGRMYTPKDGPFNSDAELDKLFANKFKRVGAATKRPRDRDDSLDNSGRVMDRPEHLKIKEEKKRAEGRVDPAAGRKPRGFAAKAADGARARGEAEDEDFTEDELSELGDDGGEEEIDIPDFGEDVTGDFPAKFVRGKHVHKGEGGFTVVDEDAPHVPLNGEKPIAEEDELLAFLKDNAKEAPPKAKKVKVKKTKKASK